MYQLINTFTHALTYPLTHARVQRENAAAVYVCKALLHKH